MPTAVVSSVTTAYHVTPAANLKYVIQAGLTPRIGPRSDAAGEAIPAIFLFPSIEAAEDAVSNWLGEELTEAPLALLRITLEQLAVLHSETPWELMTFAPIPPSQIEIVQEDF